LISIFTGSEFAAADSLLAGVERESAPKRMQKMDLRCVVRMASQHFMARCKPNNSSNN
jgi:hypothetical protein